MIGSGGRGKKASGIGKFGESNSFTTTRDDLIWAFLVSFTVRGMIFVNGFLLMNQLWVPPKVWMVSYRLLIWFALGHLAFRELHNSLTNGGEAF